MSVPSELEDALSRLNSTVEDYALLQQEMDKFLYRYVGGMIKGFNPTTGNFVLQLRHPKESIVSGRPKVLTVQIAEHLRSVLDYVVFELSAKNNPGLNKRQPQFVMADDRATFKKESKRRLRHLKDVERTFVEQLQPYHGNWILRVMRDPTGKSKHRRLLSVRDMTSLTACISQCAVERRCFSVGANPTRQLSLQPVAVGAVHSPGNDMD